MRPILARGWRVQRTRTPTEGGAADTHLFGRVQRKKGLSNSLPVELRCGDAERRGVSLGLGMSRLVAARVSEHAAREDHNFVIKDVEVRVPPWRIKYVSKSVGDGL